MTKRLQQSKVQAYFKINRIEIEDHVVSSNYEEVEPVVTSLQVSKPLTSDSCTTISTPSLNTTHIQSSIVTVNDLSKNADEVKDASKKELLGASLRYIHKGNVRERAIGFIELKDMDAGTISEKLIELLKPFELDPLKCVGQGYHGASDMSGIHGGVQARMKGAGYRSATYVHCASHRLNLVLAATAERHTPMKSFFDILDLTYSFMNGTKLPTVFIDVQDERYLNVQALELARSYSTRWSSRSLEVGMFLRRFDCIFDTLTYLEMIMMQTQV
ncbi:Zinc finger MYM-type protein 1-like [Oopsacas minuta]|uniref:Zinc finger MYM-type protein 1-like n=1 Tax=Oopsacas minuta TaxID=111878 RepID=A0AAV7JI64_9METZ|nr:Zinc finger MYM-type protein 1-like [Oopsacas minuta]